MGAPPPVVTIGHHVLFILGSYKFKLLRPVNDPKDFIYFTTVFANPVDDVRPEVFQSI